MKPSAAWFFGRIWSWRLGLHVRRSSRRPRDRRACPPPGCAPCLLGPSRLPRPTSFAYISPRTLKTSKTKIDWEFWYVSNVSIIFYCSMLLYYLFWMFMGFTLHFYIIFGTNLLTGGISHIVVFLPILVFQRKGIWNGVQTEWNLRKRDFLTERDPGDLDLTPRHQRGGHEGAPPRARPLPRGPLGAPPTYFFLLYISTYPQTIGDGAKNLIPPPQLSLSTRSHLGACSGAPPERASSRRASTSS